MRIPPVPMPVRRLFEALPQYPHSLAASAALNVLLGNIFGPVDKEQVCGKIVCLHVRDAGIRIKLRIETQGYAPADDRVEPHVTISAAARDFLLLALRKEDPDTLFFDRRLHIEGDTAVGLIVKNALDHVTPPLPARLFDLLRNHLT